jgi:hypothetical protein
VWSLEFNSLLPPEKKPRNKNTSCTTSKKCFVLRIQGCITI